MDKSAVIKLITIIRGRRMAFQKFERVSKIWSGS